MIYQVRANLFFDEEDEARDFYRDCDLALAKSTAINPNDENIEFGLIELTGNNHAEDPNQPCEAIYSANNKPEH